MQQGNAFQAAIQYSFLHGFDGGMAREALAPDDHHPARRLRIGERHMRSMPSQRPGRHGACGRTVMPMPEATIWRMVSAKAFKVRAMRRRRRARHSGHTSAPGRGSNGRCPAIAWFPISTRALMLARSAQAWCLGSATTNGSSYSGCTIKPCSGTAGDDGSVQFALAQHPAGAW